MSYSVSNSIGLLMPNANSYDYTGMNPSPFLIVELGFTSQDQSDGDPIEENLEGDQTYHSRFGYLPNELDSSNLFFNCQDPYGNQNGCRKENTELILFHNEDQLEDYNGDSRNLYHEFAWDYFQSWLGFGEDEHGNDCNGQDLKPEPDCSSDALALLEAILGY